MGNYYGVVRSNEYLSHVGVKGMKWGIRKQQEKTGIKRTKAYNNAKEKLDRITRASTIGGTVGGIAGGLAKGFAGGAIGGVAGTLAGAGVGALANRIKNGPKKSASANKRKSVNATSKFNAKDKEFAAGMKKAGSRAGFVGGIGGSAVGTLKYMHDHPKEYAAYKKKFKQASFKDRMKMMYG